MFNPRHTDTPPHTEQHIGSPSTPPSHPAPALPVPSLFPGRQWQQVLERDVAADLAAHKPDTV